MNKKLKEAASKATIALALTTTTNANAAVDMYLELEGIKGPSKVTGYEEAFDILAWTWGMSSTSNLHYGLAVGIGKANFQDISLTKYVDSSSSNLYQALVKGTIISKGSLTVLQGGEKPYVSTRIEFDNLIISSSATGGSGGEDVLTENFTLNFQKFCIQNGTAEVPIEEGQKFCFDIAANQEF